MSDLKLFQLLLLGQAVGLLWLVLTWVTLPPVERWTRLTAIAATEPHASALPLTLLEQGRWLLDTRLTRVQGLSLVLGLAGLMGLAQGWARRRHEALGGFRFTWWTIGTTLVVLCPGLLGSYVLWPVPVPRWTLVSVGFAGVAGMMGYGLGRGKPYIP